MSIEQENVVNWPIRAYNEWRITNFRSCALKERDEFLHSPPNHFLGADFIIKLHIRGREKYMHMGLARTISSDRNLSHACNKIIDLMYRIGIKNYDGTEFISWKENWTFPCDGCTGRLWERIDLTNVLCNGKVTEPDGALTLFCEFTDRQRMKKVAKIADRTKGTQSKL